MFNLPRLAGRLRELHEGLWEGAMAVVDRVIHIWTEALRTEDIRADDDFFELGGNSIIAVRLIPLIKQAFGVEPNISVILDHPTPRELAAALKALGTVETSGSLEAGSG